MKFKTLLFSSLSVLLLISCSQGGAKDGGVPADEAGDREPGVEEEVVVVTPDADEDEEFSVFMEQFSNDESFQLRRIKFPISVIIPDMSDVGMAPTKESIGKYDWEPLDLTYDSTYLTRPFDQYYQVVRYRNDTAVVEIRGINNGIYADYYFTLIDRKWYLVTLYEASF
jgi:hypothetical protein